jgi:hypothetical protein
MLNEIEALLANGYTLKSVIECNSEIFAFLLNESELRGIRSRTTTIEEQLIERKWYDLFIKRYTLYQSIHYCYSNKCLNWKI